MVRWSALIVSALVFAAIVCLGVAHVVWSIGARSDIAAARERVRALDESGFTAGDLTEEQLHILLAVEDPNFFGHHGVDMMTPGAGVTTITQGLSKILFFDEFKPGLAKIRQTSLAFTLDRAMPKEDQLTLMLNLANMGTAPDGTWLTGFPAAAEAYFGESVPELSDDEFINLVARLIAPGRYSRDDGAAALAERVGRIKLLLAGACAPTGVRDVYYRACARA